MSVSETSICVRDIHPAHTGYVEKLLQTSHNQHVLIMF